MVGFNAPETIKLVEEKFSGNHKEMIDALSKDPHDQLLYLEALLSMKDVEIQDAIREYSIHS